MDDQITDERRREAYRNAASNLLAFGHESDPPADPISDALATLTARGFDRWEPVILTLPAGMVDVSDDPMVVPLDAECLAEE